MTTVDRTEHLRRIGAKGGQTTVARHGISHMRAIGKAGARATITRHGYGYWRGLVGGWNGRRQPESVRLTLAVGALYANW